MKKLFNRILVPLELTEASHKTLARAIEMANAFECDIHVLHVVPLPVFAGIPLAEGSILMPMDSAISTREEEKVLENLLEAHRSQLNIGLCIMQKVIQGTWNEEIIQYVLLNGMDLVFLSQPEGFLQSRHPLADANRIAERTCIPVITVPGKRRMQKLYSIVVPVTDFLPVKKLTYAIYMAQYYHATIKLLGIVSEHDADRNRKVHHYLQKSYQLIHDNCPVSVEIATTSANNIAEALREYTVKNNADLLIVNPGRQSRLPGLFSRWWGNFIQKYSLPPVLTISTVS